MKMAYLILGACLAAATPHIAFAAEPAATPPACADDPLFRQQDFAIGTWDVFSGTEKTAQVRMERSLAGCAIYEVWTELGGKPGSGLGLYTYSRLINGWHYLWASDTGSATSFVGTLIKPGEMLYKTTRPLPDGRTRLRHWHFVLQPDGRLRELSLGSDDEGKTWVTEYDLMWVKVGK